MRKPDGTTPVLSESDMRAAGFSDHVPTSWYFCENVGSNVTVNFSIDKETGSYTEDVLDEWFGQPAYYGHMTPKYGIPIREKVNQILDRLNSAGLTLNVDHCLYGFSA